MAFILSELKQAHALLLEEYLCIIDELSDQGFFMDLSPDHKLPRDAKGIQKLKWLLAKINRTNPLAVKALVRLFTEIHIRGKLQEIRNIYHQRKLVLNNKRGNSALVKWFDQAILETQEFEDTLQFWKSIWDATASIFGVVSAGAVALFGLGSLFDVIPKLYDYLSNIPTIDVFLDVLFRIGMVGVFIILPFTVVFSSFSDKRKLFLKGNESFDAHINSVYGKEENLFLLLNREKAKEYQYDLMTMLLVGGLYLVYELWFYRQIMRFGGAEFVDASYFVQRAIVIVVIIVSTILISFVRKER